MERAPAARECDAGEEPDGKDVGEPRLEGDVFVLLPGSSTHTTRNTLSRPT